MRDKMLKKLAYWHANHPWRMLTIVIILTIVLVALSAQLTVTMNMKDLLPSGDPKLDEFNKIIDEFATATSLIAVVQGDEKSIKAFADELAPRILELVDTTLNTENQRKIAELQLKINKLKEKENKSKKIAEYESQIRSLQKRMNLKLFQRVDYKMETNFFRNHSLMLVKEDDLENTKELFMDPNLSGLLIHLNNSMEKEYIGKEQSISTREKEEGAWNFLDGIQQLVLNLNKAANGENLNQTEAQVSVDELLLGEPYFLSYDKKALILNCIPNFTIMDRDLLMVGYETVKTVIADLQKQYPYVHAGLTGDIAREHDEQVYSQQSLSFTTIIAFMGILILLIISLRMWVAPVLAMVSLIVGLIWAMGAAYIAVQQLNMMTAMLSIVLLGLGIDFSIHIISGFTEWRATGDDILVALEKTFLKSGKGIITGALTTACAFLALLISQSRGMKEMGIVTGLGLLSIMLATFLFLPVLLVFRGRLINRKREKTQKFVKRDISFRTLGHFGNWLSKHNIFTIIASAIISALLIWSAFQIEYDQNYLRLEPKGLESIALQDTILEKFDLSMEYALCLTDDVDESRKLAEEYRDLGTVAMTNDISVYIPSIQEQRLRVPHLQEIRNQMESAMVREIFSANELPTFITEIERLEMNVMEMQDMAFLGGQDKVDNKCKQIVGDPDSPNPKNIIRDLLNTIASDKPQLISGLSAFQKYFAPYFKQSVIKMSSTDPIQLEDLPVSVLDQYSNRDRSKFLITIYPKSQLFSNATVMKYFVDDVEQVSEKTTGGPPVAIAWLRIAGRDGRNAILLTLLIVFILLWIDFRRPWYALIAMIPLALGAFWMVGLMNIVGLLLNFMTLIGLPLIIGIGIDDGVHIMHRWQHEGNGKIFTVFSSTGKAILLTSLTTMLAFGSMIFSVFPAWAWFGGSLFIGVGACFVTTVLVLPGILGWIEKRNHSGI